MRRWLDGTDCVETTRGIIIPVILPFIGAICSVLAHLIIRGNISIARLRGLGSKGQLKGVMLASVKVEWMEKRAEY